MRVLVWYVAPQHFVTSHHFYAIYIGYLLGYVSSLRFFSIIFKVLHGSAPLYSSELISVISVIISLLISAVLIMVLYSFFLTVNPRKR